MGVRSCEWGRMGLCPPPSLAIVCGGSPERCPAAHGGDGGRVSLPLCGERWGGWRGTTHMWHGRVSFGAALESKRCDVCVWPHTHTHTHTHVLLTPSFSHPQYPITLGRGKLFRVCKAPLLTEPTASSPRPTASPQPSAQPLPPTSYPNALLQHCPRLQLMPL